MGSVEIRQDQTERSNGTARVVAVHLTVSVLVLCCTDRFPVVLKKSIRSLDWLSYWIEYEDRMKARLIR